MVPDIHAVAARPVVSVVVPAYNEADVLPEFHRRLASVLDAVDGACEMIYVDDGSTDSSLGVMHDIASRDARAVVVALSRNFGKEAAMTAGLEHASGEAVIVIDADLQDPPEEIPAMLAQWREGADMVLMQRSSRAGESWFKQWTARRFYRVMDRLGEIDVPGDVGDFRLLSRRAVDAVRQLRERTRFMKGLYSWVGFRQVILRYERDARHAGETKWNYWRLWNFAIEGITSFSTAPLKIASYAGFAVAFGAFLFGAKVLLKTMFFGDPVQGFTTLVTVVLFLGGVQLMALGVIGEYLGRVFVEVKRRPLYIIESVRRGPGD
ncbi:MAG: glycosyltransferase family 2 protein [Pseudomonadota bacterium]